MEDFSSKNVVHVGDWLREQKFSEKVVDSFQGKVYSFFIFVLVDNIFLNLDNDIDFLNLDNDIDGETFLILEENDFSQLITSIGERRKLILKQRELNCRTSSVQVGLMKKI